MPENELPRTEPKKHVLLISLGMTPEILTEAIWWHAKVAQPAVLFEKIVALTTTKGQTLAVEKLFGKGFNYYGKLSGALQGKIPAFITNDIVVLQSSSGEDLEDLIEYDSSVVENILEQIRALHEDGYIVHGCYAGGRKLVGPLFNTAFQLAARPGDKLCHVLVHAQLEGNLQPDWCFPVNSLRGSKGTSISPSEQINCVDTPILYWPGTRTERENGTRSVADLLRDRQFEFDGLYDPHPLAFHREGEGRDAQYFVTVGDRRIYLTWTQWLLYMLFAFLVVNETISPDQQGIRINHWREAYQQRGPSYNDVNRLLATIIDQYQPQTDKVDRRHAYGSRLHAWLSDPPPSSLDTELSRLGRSLASGLPGRLGELYAIKSLARSTPHRIWLDPAKILFTDAQLGLLEPRPTER